jgi:hypothetical protein
MFDFSDIKNSITDIKRDLREEKSYGNRELLARTYTKIYTSGYNNDDIFDLGFISGQYTNTYFKGIQEEIPKGNTRTYKNSSFELDGDIRFTVEKYSGSLIESLLDTNTTEFWINHTKDVNDELILNGTEPSGAKRIEYTAYINDLFNTETCFYFNIK